MRRLIPGVLMMALLVAVLGCILYACSQQTIDTFLRNLTAAQCATPQSQEASIANFPLGVLTMAQAQEIVAAFCVGEFGTVSAPTPAPGMQPAIPGPATPTPIAASPTPTTAPAQ